MLSAVWTVFWLAVAFTSGAVVGAKHKEITLFLYEKYKLVVKTKIEDSTNKNNNNN